MAEPSADGVYLGIDVGTGSARAGVFDKAGKMLACAAESIQSWRPEAGFVEQSSNDIWRAVCSAVAQALGSASVAAERVRGIGFDATCSLVVLDAADQPVTVSPGGSDEQNVIVWMDHRAIDQADRINAAGHDVLKYVGGRISPEMETPKLVWLKQNLPASWQRAARFLDLPDYLVYRATGEDVRSLCSTVCKWTYQVSSGVTEAGWSASYFRQIGLDDLVAEGFARIGTRVRSAGEAVGRGLKSEAAGAMGLVPGTPVGVSIIDAHAGGIGMIGAPLDGVLPSIEALDTRLALIGGTSSCHMAVSKDARFIPGVWGPYYSAMVPDMWLTEGGQSATGALIDHVIFASARAAELQDNAAKRGQTVYELLNERLDRLCRTTRFPAELTRDLHILPYFHGNRSPRADASLRGVVSGLTLGDTVDDLALLYLAAVQAVAHGTRHIIETLNHHGYRISTIFACGGGTKNPVFLREHADITGCRIVLPRESESVLMGAAILGAVAAGDFGSVMDASMALGRAGDVVEPATGAAVAYHRAKHSVFQHMYDAFIAQREIMSQTLPTSSARS